MERKHLEELRNCSLEIADIITENVSAYEIRDTVLDQGIIMDDETSEQFIEELQSELSEFVIRFANFRLKETESDKRKLLWKYVEYIITVNENAIKRWKDYKKDHIDDKEIDSIVERLEIQKKINTHILDIKIMDYAQVESSLYDEIASEDYKVEGFPFTIGQLQMMYNYCKKKINE